MTPLPDNLLDTLSDDDLLLLHLAGELPEAQRVMVEARLAMNPDEGGEWAKAFYALDGRLCADAKALSLPPVGPAVQQIVGAIRSADPLPIDAARGRLWRPPTWTLYPAVAALLMVMVMGGWWYKVRDDLAVNVTPTNVEPGFATVFRGDADRDLGDLSDDQIAMQFDAMVVEPRLGIEQPLSELNYLESLTQ
ncbi:MAG: hypothetical protein JWM57_2991 [Phycisphaerales bacterium]|nr:hypothetical protein [Phycisphaerales bacterium]